MPCDGADGAGSYGVYAEAIVEAGDVICGLITGVEGVSKEYDVSSVALAAGSYELGADPANGFLCVGFLTALPS